jgi:hypothetical protein
MSIDFFQAATATFCEVTVLSRDSDISTNGNGLDNYGDWGDVDVERTQVMWTIKLCMSRDARKTKDRLWREMEFEVVLFVNSLTGVSLNYLLRARATFSEVTMGFLWRIRRIVKLSPRIETGWPSPASILNRLSPDRSPVVSSIAGNFGEIDQSFVMDEWKWK